MTDGKYSRRIRSQFPCVSDVEFMQTADLRRGNRWTVNVELPVMYKHPKH